MGRTGHTLESRSFPLVQWTFGLLAPSFWETWTRPTSASSSIVTVRPQSYASSLARPEKKHPLPKNTHDSPAMMDQRELDSSIRQLQKVVTANEPSSNALAILERLKKEASPTEEMLRVSTQCARMAQQGKARTVPRRRVSPFDARRDRLTLSSPLSRPAPVSSSASCDTTPTRTSSASRPNSSTNGRSSSRPKRRRGCRS